MELHIGEKIAAYRKEQGLTQEELAGRLGVSGAAVSKWENQVAYPDITLLPALARCLSKSVDQLLSFQPSLSSEQVMDINRELAAVFETESFEAGMKKSKAYLRDYPTDAFLQFRVASLWQTYLVRAGSEEKAVETLSACAELLEKAAQSGEPKVSAAAEYTLGCAYLTLGKLELAKEIFERQKTPAGNTALMLSSVYRDMGDVGKAEELAQNELFRLLGEMNVAIMTLLGLQTDPKEKLRMLLMQKNVLEALQVSDPMLANVSLQLASLYAQTKERKQTLFYLKDYGEKIQTQDNHPKGSWFSQVKLMKPIASQSYYRQLLRMQVVENPSFTFLKDDPAFQKIAASLS